MLLTSAYRGDTMGIGDSRRRDVAGDEREATRGRGEAERGPRRKAEKGRRVGCERQSW